MSPYKRNVVVGATVLVALVVLAWMILRFSGGVGTLFAPEQFRVTFVTPRADGIADGSAILYRGVEAGRILTVRLGDDQKTVVVEGLLNRYPPLPANIQGVIRNNSLLGSGAAIVLELQGGEPEGELQAGTTIPTRFVGLELLPPEFAQLATELRVTTEQFRKSNLIEDLDAEVKRAGQLVGSLQKLVDDPQMQGNLRETLANVKAASEAATRIAGNLETFTQKLDKVAGEASETLQQAKSSITRSENELVGITRQVGDRLQQTARLLEDVHSITSKIDAGEGTAGQLINDPRLYESLVDTSRELNTTIKDLKRLVAQWEQEGVSFKLK